MPLRIIAANAPKQALMRKSCFGQMKNCCIASIVFAKKRANINPHVRVCYCLAPSSRYVAYFQ